VAEPKDPQVKIVDRRWWARGESTEPAEEARERKPTVVEDLEQRLNEAQEHLQAVLLEHRRAADEFEQAKARIRRDVTRDVERGRRAVLVDMLDVLDNLDRAVAAARRSNLTEASETLLRGVELVHEQFLSKLHTFGVVRLEAVGQPFDPQLHEAVSLLPVDDPADAGRVVSVMKEGYMIGDDLLRVASVAVGAHV
jgi:molecular chaperone GrpE